MAGRRGKAADYDVALPIDLEDQRSVEKPKRRYIKPKGYAACPKCHAERVALLQQGAHVVWKEHTYRTWSGAPLTCQSSGVRLCDLDQRSTIGLEPVACPCGGKA